jgi:diguanylate cyclase (GGDEF)-like protein
VNLTVSLGISTFPEDGRNEDDLLKKADEALYNAKDLGRNSVCISA